MRAARWIIAGLAAFALCAPVAHGSLAVFKRSMSNGVIQVTCDAVVRVPISITTLQEIPAGIEIDVEGACVGRA